MEVKTKPDYSKWRAISLAGVYLLMAIHIAHWKLAGQTLAPLEFNEVLYTLHLGIITAGFIFMGLTLLSTFIFGRFFCSWMCHILALQDMSEWILSKLKIKPRFIRSRTLLWVPFIVMGYLFVMPQIERLYKGLPAAALKVQTDSEGWASFITNDFWRNLPGIGITLFTFFICGFLIIYFLGSRSFCQYACPYGAIFAIADRIAPGKIKLTGDCNQCGICTSVCSSHIQVHKEIEHFGKVVDQNCLKDLDCVQACPNDAIKFGFTKPSGWSSLYNIKSIKQRYDFTLVEDLLLLPLFGIATITYFGLYDSIPFLLAVAIAIILSAMVMKFYRLFKVECSTINKYVLKRSDRLTGFGKSFILVFLVLVAFSFHSMFIRYHQLSGEKHYNKIAFIKNNNAPELNQADVQEHLTVAEHHLATTYKYGFYKSASLLRQLSAIAIYHNDNANSKKFLEEMVAKLPNDLEARLRLAKLNVLLGLDSEALSHLKFIVLKDVKTSGEKRLKSDALLTLGHLEEKGGFPSEALNHFRMAIIENDKNGEAWLAAGVLFNKSGNLKEAEHHLTNAAGFFPDSPIIENNLAVIYMKLKVNDKAKNHLEKLLKLQPGNIQAAYNLAMVNYALGLYAEAVYGLELVLRHDPNHKNAAVAMARMHDKQKHDKQL